MMKNRAKISGKIISNIEFQYHAWGQDFFLFQMAVKRKSEKIDHIWVMVSDSFIFTLPGYGEYITVIGSLRNSNMLAHGRYVFADEIKRETEETYENKVDLSGIVVSDSFFRKKEDGREITTVIIASNRRNGNSSYIPIVAWGRNAILLKNELKKGDFLSGTGRYLERQYLKEGVLNTTYEASMDVVRIERRENNAC